MHWAGPVESCCLLSVFHPRGQGQGHLWAHHICEAGPQQPEVNVLFRSMGLKMDYEDFIGFLSGLSCKCSLFQRKNPFQKEKTPFRRTNPFSRGKRYILVRANCWRWHQLLGGQVFAVACSWVSDRPPWSHMLLSCTIPLPFQKEQPQPIKADNSDQCLLEKITADIQDGTRWSCQSLRLWSQVYF